MEFLMSTQRFARVMLPNAPSVRIAVALALAGTVLVVPATGFAGPRDECVDAHSRAQDLRDRGQIAQARRTFLTCAQSSCPSLVQQDCARYGEELATLVPTVTFSARDANAADLPATTVYVDDAMVATRLDDGKSYEVDPGKHVIRYVHDGRETTLRVVLNQGERGRLLIATFVDRAPAARREREAPETIEPPVAESKRSVVPLVFAGIGAAAAVTGGVLYGMGTGSVPDSCSVSTRECATAPNDPSLSKAESGVRLANTGLAVGIAGAVTVVGGIIWYLVQPSGSSDSRRGRIGGPVFTF
jgi:hypothetical protein